ncbi:MAG: 1-(5-phosphoribosyl)-5-[(5-phosphoribosylamino)methylideneamino]imidazole-4-carboxamide isomerase [Myxococcota bacterium]
MPGSPERSPARLELIPALDLRGGQLVRLVQGDYGRETVYDADPPRVAARFVAAGATRLHVVDLDGARAGRPCHEAVLREILVAARDVPVQIGGGLRSMESIETLLGLGAERVILGTVAIEQPDLLRAAAARFPGRIVLGLDARDGRVAIRGWRESSGRRVEELIDELSELPLAAVLHTDIARDGTLDGPDVEGTARLARRTTIPVIASGGVASLDDLLSLARERVIAGAIVGRALYTGDLDLAAALEALERC